MARQVPSVSSSVLERAVLLVDDEPQILRAMEIYFHRERPEWRCVTMTSAEAALLALARADYDAIVSDMQMPGMRGDQLLRLVRDVCPAMGRLVLSGETVSRVGDDGRQLAHAILTKPCAAITVIETIERVCAELASKDANLL